MRVSILFVTAFAGTLHTTSAAAFVKIGDISQPIQNIAPQCLTDDECWSLKPAYSGAPPFYCIERRCQDPSNLPTSPIVRKRSGIKAKFNRTFVVREDKELERVFARPLKTFYGREHNMKEFELYDNTDELVEVEYPTDFLSTVTKLLEEPNNPGHVLGRKDEGETKDGAEVPERFFNFTFGKGRRLAAIQGVTPNRWHVTNSASNPWRRNGRLSMGCTGALIGNRVIVTAAHCLYDRETDTYASWPLYFSAGQDGATKPYGDSRVYMRYVPSGYRTCNSVSSCRAHDWALLVLYDWSELNVGYFGFSTSIGGSTLNLAGYPQSKNRELWYDNCPLHADMGKWIKHRCDTEPGNSGSGIYKIVGGSRYVVAVHGGGYAYLWNRGADVDGKTASNNQRMFDKMLAYRQTYG